MLWLVEHETGRRCGLRRRALEWLRPRTALVTLSVPEPVREGDLVRLLNETRGLVRESAVLFREDFPWKGVLWASGVRRPDTARLLALRAAPVLLSRTGGRDLVFLSLETLDAAARAFLMGTAERFRYMAVCCPEGLFRRVRAFLLPFGLAPALVMAGHIPADAAALFSPPEGELTLPPGCPVIAPRGRGSLRGGRWLRRVPMEPPPGFPMPPPGFDGTAFLAHAVETGALSAGEVLLGRGKNLREGLDPGENLL